MCPFNRREIVPSQEEPSLRRARLFRAVLTALFLLAVAILAGIHFLRPVLTSKGLAGKFMNAVAVPNPDGGYRLWILSDGSFQYISRVESPGRISIARKCKFCKTWTSVYDPVTKTVLAKFKTDYTSVIIQSWMAYENGKIWIATDAYEDNEPQIFVYGAEQVGLVRETADLVRTYPELGSGLIKVRMEKDPDRFILDTKDGRVGLVLVLGDEKIYESESELKKARAPGDEEQATIYALSQEGGGPRKILFKVTGPRGKVKDSSLEFLLANPQSLMSWSNATAERVAPGSVFIEGVIFHQDPDGCLVLHQDAAGKAANRLLTCLDANGNQKWTAGPTELFQEMKVDLDKDPLSNIVFVKGNLDVSRSGSLVLLQLKGVGLIGFDFTTGQKLWEIRL